MNKLLRVNMPKGEKQLHLIQLAAVINTPQWDGVREEMEDAMIKEYLKLETCETLEEFITVKATVAALKRLASLNGLVEVIKGKRNRIRSPYEQVKQSKE